MARRINDGILLSPEQGMDLDMLAAFIDQKNKGANVLLEAMKNPTKQKGGLALTTPTKSPYGFLLEGLNAKDEKIQRKIDELNAASGGVPYNRFYLVYDLEGDSRYSGKRSNAHDGYI